MDGFKFKVNTAAVKQITNVAIKALEATGEKMLSEKIEAQEIPFAEGTLQNMQSGVDKASLNNGELQIYHDTPYASRLYYHPEFNFNQEFNTNAKGEWWEDYISGKNKDRPHKLYEHYLKKYGGGIF